MRLLHLFAINLRGMESLQEPLAMEWTSSELMEMTLWRFMKQLNWQGKGF